MTVGSSGKGQGAAGDCGARGREPLTAASGLRERGVGNEGPGGSLGFEWGGRPTRLGRQFQGIQSRLPDAQVLRIAVTFEPSGSITYSPVEDRKAK